MLTTKQTIDFSKEFVRHLEKSIVFFERFETLEQIVAKLEERVSEAQAVHNQTLRLIHDMSLKLEDYGRGVKPELLQEVVRQTFEKSALRQELVNCKRLIENSQPSADLGELVKSLSECVQRKGFEGFVAETKAELQGLGLRLGVQRKEFDGFAAKVGAEVQRLALRVGDLSADLDRQMDEKIAKIGGKMSTIHSVCSPAGPEVHGAAQRSGGELKAAADGRKVNFEEWPFVEG